MTPSESGIADLRTRFNGLFAKIEEVRGFL
jgi:hypothetical protein